MSHYFTADTHFGHANIIRYCNRPFANINEMDDALIDNINAKVKENDTLWHLGDFCFGNKERVYKYRGKIKCRNIHLNFGNHDRVYKSDHSIYTKLFSTVEHFRETKINNQLIVMCHYALRVWNKSHHGSWHLYGHSHGSLPDDPYSRSFDVGVDCHDYRPLSFDEVAAIIENKSWEPRDHHGRN